MMLHVLARPLGLIRAMVAALALGSVLSVAALAQTPVAIAGPEDLQSALQSGGGRILELAPGDYGALRLEKQAATAEAPLVLRSADPANPARFSRLDLRRVSHLTLEGLIFDYSFSVGDAPHLRPFQIFQSDGIELRGNLFDGDTVQGQPGPRNGFPTAFGLNIVKSRDVIVENNEIRGFLRGVLTSSSDAITLRGNNLHGLRSDGMNFAQVGNVLIERNHFHDFDRAPDTGDHADMIQFWSRGTTSPSHDITIRDNILNSGKGLYTQSIFLRNDLVDRGLAGPEMFYRNISITGNVIINAHLHGIAVGETAGLVVANNTVIRNAASAGSEDNRGLWTPQIRVSPEATGVRITNNVTSRVAGYGDQPDWQVRDNFLVQDQFPAQPGFYDKVFVAARSGDPRALASFGYLPGGPLDGTGFGSDQLSWDALSGTKLSASRAIIRVLADQTLTNRFRLDGASSILPRGVALKDVAFEWSVDAAPLSDTPAFTHDFAQGGPHQVSLALTFPDQSRVTATTQIDVPGPEVLTFSSMTGNFTSYATRDARVVPDLFLGLGPAVLGQGIKPINIPVEMIAPFFDSGSFELKLRLRGAGNFHSAGELLRIHKTMIVNVTGRGNLDILFGTATAAQLKLVAGPVDLFSGRWVDLVLRYSSDQRLFQVEVDGTVIREGHTQGNIRPMEAWGLALGNPFAKRKSFDGELESLSLQVNQNTNALQN